MTNDWKDHIDQCESNLERDLFAYCFVGAATVHLTEEQFKSCCENALEYIKNIRKTKEDANNKSSMPNL